MGRCSVSAAERQRRFRTRASRGVSVLLVPVVLDPLIETLIRDGRISEADALDPAKVALVAAQVLAEWASRWRRFP